jgi:hypothetical protein
VACKRVEDFSFFCLSKRKKQRKRHHENQLQAFVLPAKASRHIATKLAVRTFRGRPPHGYVILFQAKIELMKPRARNESLRCDIACAAEIMFS